MDDAPERLTLITLHQAKGLEYPVVFMVGMEDGLLPHSRSLDEEASIEEERRLCYVGMTRAKDKLYLTRAFRRGFRGGTGPNLPSRFLLDIPSELTSAGEPDAPPSQDAARPPRSQRPASRGNGAGRRGQLPVQQPQSAVVGDGRRRGQDRAPASAASRAPCWTPARTPDAAEPRRDPAMGGGGRRRRRSDARFAAADHQPPPARRSRLGTRCGTRRSEMA